MPNNKRSKNKVSRSSPYQRPATTIEGDVAVIDPDSVEDPVLKDLLSRLGELNKSEQRRLMVKYRKELEKRGKGQREHKGSTTFRTARRIAHRFPGVEELISDARAAPDADDDEVVVITTRPATGKRRRNGSRTTKSASSNPALRRSARLQKQEEAEEQELAPLEKSNEEPEEMPYTNEIVYKGTGTKRSKKQGQPKKSHVTFAPEHSDPFQDSSVEDPDYDVFFERIISDGSSDDEDADHDGNLRGFITYGEGSDDSADDEPIIGLNEEINDLHDDMPYTTRKRKRELDSMSEEEREKFHFNLRQIRETHESQKVDIGRVIQAEFSEEDSIWFYSRLVRLQRMEGKERYDLEDNIQRKFATLASLKACLFMMMEVKSTRRLWPGSMSYFRSQRLART